MPRFAVSTLTLLTAAAVIAAAPAPASDPIGVFAVIDRVVLEPDATNPSTVQVWGVFSMADKGDPNNYLPPQRGYLYYSVGRNQPATQAEWADFKAVAGTGQPLGWGSRYAEKGRIRRASEAPSNPDVYNLGFGLVKVMSAGNRAGVADQLLSVPLPVTPADGARVRAGQVRLVARNGHDPNVTHYVFQITGPGNKSETSQPQAAGKGETSWAPSMRVEDGQSYTWRVWGTKGGWTSQQAVSAFRAGDK